MRLFFLLLPLVFLQKLQAQDFPDSFIGHWNGEISWFRSSGMERIKMQLVVSKTDTAGQFEWKIIYGEKESDTRPYCLKPVDLQSGHWVIDERNGILLDQFWRGGRLSGSFSVLNSSIINSYWINGDSLHVEFLSFHSIPLRTTGGQSDEIPPVQSFSLKSFQKGVLTRKK